jgi:hypothetical protein
VVDGQVLPESSFQCSCCPAVILCRDASWWANVEEVSLRNAGGRELLRDRNAVLALQSNHSLETESVLA